MASGDLSGQRAHGASIPPYEGLRVVELAGDPAGELTSRFLADMGADVVKVELPDGSPTRRVGPFAGGADDPERSLTFWHYNTNKRSVVIDYRAPEGFERFRALLARADIVVSTLAPPELRELGIEAGDLRSGLERLIVLSVTPFGLDGPRADWLTSDLVGLALGGPLLSCGYSDHSIPPIRPGGNQGYHQAASFAHIGLLLALLEREHTGRGQVVDVAMHDCLAVGAELANPYWFYSRAIIQRQTCRHAQPTRTQPAIFLCADGRYVYFVLIVAELKPWRALVQWMSRHDLAADLADPAYEDTKYRQANFGHIQGVVECFFLLIEADDAYHEGQSLGLPIGVINAPEDLLRDEHLRARHFFTTIEHRDATSAEYPGSPYRFSAFAPPPRRRAPALDEHEAEVAQQWLGSRAGGGAP